MKYMMDTNTCIFLMKNRLATVNHYKAKKHLGIVISSVTVAELYFGVYNSQQIEKNGANLANFLVGPESLLFDNAAAVEYGRIKATLRRQGTPIGPLDMLIAAHAKSLGLIMVTNNISEFERVEGLTIEDWAE